ncbi:hypothetical protein [Rickettsia peacockii]|uniref:hypothetical protein n=1 Tax=Rickettsia peacockii TaxID=47589 RepID=UPI0002E8AAC0|nr:hypothetical protein [Rickettsia peacockii]
MIIDDRNKFHEILSSKDIEENMGFNNIYKIKRYEFFRESFVKEFKALIEEIQIFLVCTIWHTAL